ncbi:P-loop containing nucleoside triphosphate hydrolase protein [Irpex rosettiformis]|uniref:P-loop containing nucleoside triphosphate hydrolase protein n=1 Tax=Irpex rosettiformis TaxID=378272 RepID=A0ACB8U762_9APHY|nr:P-loop containing nucleoside triphosphate hydrolase protein [Irpex rosettiformis]
MRTIKLVVIGTSGVGKTSLRNQYISGRFTTGYRATIGADFITKSIPHHARPEEKVTLQIWDTAGQERFSSLSSAFFRGADAVLLMFDVNRPSSLEALTKWWNDFRERAPVPEDQVARFCCVFVGNKTDIPFSDGELGGSARSSPRVGVEQAMRFIDDLIPPPPLSPSAPQTPCESDSAGPLNHTPTSSDSDLTVHLTDPLAQTHSIDISVYHRHHRRKDSRSRSRTRSALWHAGTIGTMTTTHSLSEYHTPRSSVFDAFESARSSPVPRSASSSRTNLSSLELSRSRSHSPAQSLQRQRSFSSTLSEAQTITPSLFVRGHENAAEAETACTTPEPPSNGLTVLPVPEQGTKLFFTSAKTGEGVADVFEYVAKRVVSRWEYEEIVEARTLHMAEASIDGTVRLQNDGRRWNASTCCGS